MIDIEDHYIIEVYTPNEKACRVMKQVLEMIFIHFLYCLIQCRVAGGGAYSWTGHQSGPHRQTTIHTLIRMILDSPVYLTCMQWEEAGAPGENPHIHKSNQEPSYCDDTYSFQFNLHHANHLCGYLCCVAQSVNASV